jgi:type I restriction-modification system DNA methylase subunit
MEIDAGNARTGQFFTPYALSRTIAELTISDDIITNAVNEYGFFTLQEPAIGSGGMVIAAAETCKERGHNYQQCMCATGIDVDSRCVHMAYIQLSLLGIPAVIVHGNTLTLETFGRPWYTPQYILGRWEHRLNRRQSKEFNKEFIAMIDEADRN